MTSIGTYGFLNAKVRAMRSLLIADSLYRAMIASASLQELLNILSKTPYEGLSERARIEELSGLELALLHEEVRRIRMVLKASRAGTQQLVSLFLERYEGEKMKRLLRNWHRRGEEAVGVIRETIVYEVAVDAILAAEGFGDVITLLEGTPFQAALKDALPIFEVEGTVFPLEMAIDRTVFRRLWDGIASLDRKDERIAGRILGLETDLKNLEWIGRFQRYYGIPAVKMTDLLLPRGLRLGEDRVRRVAAGDDIRQALSDVIRSSRIRLPAPEGDILPLLEGFFYQALKTEAGRAFGAFPFTIGAVVGYLTLIRIESRNIRTLIQAKSYGLSPEQTEALLVF
jgi:V/A-type H+-transporting ATPase subunit C